MHTTPEVVVRFFAGVRELAGCDSVAAPARSVAELRDYLTLKLPRLAPLLARSAVAVNHEFAEDTHALSPGDEVAIIPPVSGG